MKRYATLLLLPTVVFLVALFSAHPVQTQPLVAPFDLVLPTWDSTPSAWLPTLPQPDVDKEGFLRTTSDGHFALGTSNDPVRFVGASIITYACFPDSLTAIVTARRLRKLGVNMVRFIYFDYYNANTASTLAPGNKGDTLSATQMQRLDWFLYQLKSNGVRAHFVLKARGGPRRDDGVAGWDSAYNSGQYLTFISPQFQALQRRYLTALLTHVNPYTGKRYADDPEIAVYTVSDQNSLYDGWVGDRVNQRTNTLSWNHSRTLDTLFTLYLRGRYASTAALRAAYWEGTQTLGSNLITNPGFEQFDDNWTLTVGEAAQASAVVIQGGEVAPGEGANSMRIVVRRTPGIESRIYTSQFATPIVKDHIYRLRFKAKTDTASGRTLRVVLQRNAGNFENFGVNQTVNLTTQWQTFDFTFRALGGDTLATLFRVYCGAMMGDVFLDGFLLQETGREGLGASESLDNYTVDRTRYRDRATISLARLIDQVNFYDSLARDYYSSMAAHLRSLGVKAPIAGVNSTAGAPDTWSQTGFDFTSESAQWDFNSARAGSIPYSDSTWVVRNYSVLNYRDQKLPEFSRNAIAGKPFIAEQYSHVTPNAHRAEMMLFMPAYASLHNWDGLYYYYYNDRLTEAVDRRRILKDDFNGFMGDPSICALLPQASSIVRDGLIGPATRILKIEHDAADLRTMSLYSRGTYGTDGTFNNIANLVTAVRLDSFNAARHYVAGDYYVTIPNDDDIQSDNSRIKLDITKGILLVNAPKCQAGSGDLTQSGTLRTDRLGVNWISGGHFATYIWTPLDTFGLDSSRRSLLTITTRSVNTNAVWQYGDSSLGKNWGDAPVRTEWIKLGVQFYMAADSLRVLPLDSLGHPYDGRTLEVTRGANGGWRVTIDISQEKAVWYGVEGIFKSDDTSTTSVPVLAEGTAVIGDIGPNPATDEATIPLRLPTGGVRSVSVEITDILGQRVGGIEPFVAVGGNSVLPIDTHTLSSGTYLCRLIIGDQGSSGGESTRSYLRRLVVRR